eukprot:8943606-Karenia_brevis.AAC.1
MQNFDAFWQWEREKLEDMCRQMDALPNLFFTIAPGEWKFNFHRAVHQWRTETGQSLSDGQAALTIHMHHVIGAVLQDSFLRKGSPFEADANQFKDNAFKERYQNGIEEVLEYSLRWEFQSRGTIHVHVVAWVKYAPEFRYAPQQMSGRSSQTMKEKSDML